MPPNSHSLRWLMSAVVLVLLLHVAHLAAWVIAMMVLMIAWRLLIDSKQWAFPNLWLLLPITVLSGLGIMLTYHGLFGRDASVALLCLMLSLKLMETRQVRDYVLIIFGGIFLTITAFLFTQSLLVGAYIVLPILALLTTLIGLSRPNATMTGAAHAKLAGYMLLQALPIMLVLFVLFPRIPGPLWGVPEDSYKDMTGLSDSMQPGNISHLSQSYATVFRVKFKDSIPPKSQLYWRGPVLWHYDGRTWTMRHENPNHPVESLRVDDRPVDYTITLEPHNRNWLLLLDMPNRLPPNAYITQDLQVRSTEPVRTRIRYDSSANLNYVLAETLAPQDRELATQLHDDENPETFALAASWVKKKLPPENIVNEALQMFRQEHFYYTLSPPRLGANPIDTFLFHTRRGFCEHYASSFVFLMRAAGIPARVVTGYQGGEINPVDQYVVVRQADAHAWAEVWLANRGWVRVDPTAAVSPTRIESGLEAAIPDSGVVPLMGRADYPLLRHLYLNWDAINNRWNQYVLGYDQQKQSDLLHRLTGREWSWQDMVILMMASVGAVGLIIGIFLIRGKWVKRSPLERAYRQFEKKLAKVGIQRLPQEGAQTFADKAILLFPQQSQQIQAITTLYIRLRYAKESKTMTPEREIDALNTLIRQLQLVKRNNHVKRTK